MGCWTFFFRLVSSAFLSFSSDASWVFICSLRPLICSPKPASSFFTLSPTKSGKMATPFISARDSASPYSSTTLSQGDSCFSSDTEASASRDMTVTTTVLLQIAREKPACSRQG